MTNYNNTDKIIKSKYESFDPVFDAESMWEDLAPQIENKRRKGFFVWIFSGFILLSALGFSLLSQTENHITENDTVVSSDDLKNSDGLVQINSVLDGNDGDNNEDEVKDFEEYIVGDDAFVVKSKIRNNVNDLSKKPKGLTDQRDGDGTDNMAVNTFESNSVIGSRSISKLLPLINPMIQFDRLALKDSYLFFEREIDNTAEYISMSGFYVQPLSHNKWRFGVNAGYYIHSRSFDNVGNDLSSNYSNRVAEEKAKDGYDLGLRLEYFISDHLAVIGGARFSQSFVQRSADYSYTETITLTDHVVKIINTDQGSMEITEDITYDGIFLHRAENYITATRLGLVAGLQYRLGVDRWTTHIDLGIELPIWDSHSGVITHEGRPYNIKDEGVVINTTSLQFFSGLGIEYTLSSSTALQATIGGYMPLKNEHVSTYDIEKKSTLLGLNIGMLFKL